MPSGLNSAAVALQTLRSRPLNTALSTLGIVVGIAALVGILSFGDGMEQFAREQIMRNTDFQTISVTTQTTRVVDGIQTPRSYPAIEPDDVRALDAALEDSADVAHFRVHGAIASLTGGFPNDSTAEVGTRVFATDPVFLAINEGVASVGRFISDADVVDRAPVVAISDSLAKRLSGGSPSDLLGDSVTIGAHRAEIIGVVESTGDRSALAAFVPITSFAELNRAGSPPQILARATRIEDVPAVASSIRTWMEARYGEEADAISIQTNEYRVDQVARGVLLFKIVMGMIVGLSVLVGGIGVMNVLLMSVTDMPFDAVLSAGTVLVVATAAVLLGLAFGTYPAYRASRLSPVDAIRHE